MGEVCRNVSCDEAQLSPCRPHSFVSLVLTPTCARSFTLCYRTILGLRPPADGGKRRVDGGDGAESSMQRWKHTFFFAFGYRKCWKMLNEVWTAGFLKQKRTQNQQIPYKPPELKCWCSLKCRNSWTVYGFNMIKIDSDNWEKQLCADMQHVTEGKPLQNQRKPTDSEVERSSFAGNVLLIRLRWLCKPSMLVNTLQYWRVTSATLK